MATKKFGIHTLILAISMAILLAMSSIVRAADTAPPTPVTHAARLWNLQNADILAVINQVSAETGKNFVVDPRVTGKISLISSKAVAPDQLYDIFLSVLELLGYSAIPDGAVIKIVPSMEGGEFATPLANAQHNTRPDDVVVRILPLERVSATQLIPVIRPLLPQWSNVSAYMPGNTLILLGRAANLERIVKVIHRIDMGAASDIDIVPLHNASAAQLATVLTRLQTAARNTGETPLSSIVADERSNSLLLSGNKAARLHLRFLINKLDVPAGSAEGNTEVVYLRYLQAKTFAPILNKIAHNIEGKNATDSVTSAAGTSNQTAAPPANDANQSNSADDTAGKDGTPKTAQILAEISTNAVVITAPPTLMRALKSVINRLDIRPAQVLVEGIIVQINESDLKSLGIQWGALDKAFTDNANSNFAAPGVGSIGLIPRTDIAAIISFLQTRKNTNILSTPSVTVLDNVKATLEVGQDVPFQTGTYATTGGANTVTPFTTTESKPVTLKLDVTPQINLGNAVGLTITLKNDSLQNPDNPGVTPLINTSSIKNSVIVNSGDVIVIGGLISNQAVQTVNKVPVLGYIPIIGKLFQQKNRSIAKQNLLVFIKPTILHTPRDALAITEGKYNDVRDAQIQWSADLAADKAAYTPNVLPLWRNKTQLPKPFAKPDPAS